MAVAVQSFELSQQVEGEVRLSAGAGAAEAAAGGIVAVFYGSAVLDFLRQPAFVVVAEEQLACRFLFFSVVGRRPSQAVCRVVFIDDALIRGFDRDNPVQFIPGEALFDTIGQTFAQHPADGIPCVSGLPSGPVAFHGQLAGRVVAVGPMLSCGVGDPLQPGGVVVLEAGDPPFGVDDAAQQVEGAVPVASGLPFSGDMAGRQSFLIVAEVFFATIGVDYAAQVVARVVGREVILVAGGVTGGVGELPQAAPPVLIIAGCFSQSVAQGGQATVLVVGDAAGDAIRTAFGDEAAVVVVTEEKASAVWFFCFQQVAALVVFPGG